MSKKIKVIALCGKAGSGKNYVLDNFLATYSNDIYKRVVPTTTRPKRANEQDGVDYWFVDEKSFIEDLMMGCYVGYQIFRGWNYGYSIENFRYDKINIGIFPPRAIRDLSFLDNFEVTSVEIKAEDTTRLIRQLNRDNNVDIQEVFRRYNADNEDFKEFKADATFVNSSLCQDSLEVLNTIGQNLKNSI